MVFYSSFVSNETGVMSQKWIVRELNGVLPYTRSFEIPKLRTLKSTEASVLISSLF